MTRNFVMAKYKQILAKLSFRHFDGMFALSWVIVFFGSMFVDHLIIQLLGRLLDSPNPFQYFADTLTPIGVRAVSVSLTLLVFITPQTLLLGSRGFPCYEWFIATMIGVSISLIVCHIVDEWYPLIEISPGHYTHPAAFYIITDIIRGFIIGTAQYCIMRKLLPAYCVFWILVCVLSSIVSAIPNMGWIISSILAATLEGGSLAFLVTKMSIRQPKFHPTLSGCLVGLGTMCCAFLILASGYYGFKDSTQEFLKSVVFGEAPQLTPILHLITSIVAPVLGFAFGTLGIHAGITFMVAGYEGSKGSR